MKIVSGALFILCVIFCCGCTDLTPPAPPDANAPELPEQELYDAKITFYQDESVVSILHAGRIRKFSKQTIILLDSDLVVDFYNPEGKHTVTLWADSGRVDQNRNDLRAMGNVIAKSDSGQVLETAILRWENKTRKIISDVPVKLSTPTDTIYGLGFISDEHLKNWQIDSPTGTTMRELQRRNEQRLPDRSSPSVADSSLPPVPKPNP